MKNARQAFFKLQQAIVEEVLEESEEELLAEVGRAGAEESRRAILAVVDEATQQVRQKEAAKDPTERAADLVTAIREAAWFWAYHPQANESIPSERSAVLGSKEGKGE